MTKQTRRNEEEKKMAATERNPITRLFASHKRGASVLYLFIDRLPFHVTNKKNKKHNNGVSFFFLITILRALTFSRRYMLKHIYTDMYTHWHLRTLIIAHQ